MINKELINLKLKFENIKLFILIISLISQCFNSTIINNNKTKIENCKIIYSEDFKLFYSRDGNKYSINCAYINMIYDKNFKNIEIPCRRELYIFDHDEYEKELKEKNPNKITDLVVPSLIFIFIAYNLIYIPYIELSNFYPGA